MYHDWENKEFDYVIFGSSWTESCLSAYLSKLGKKVLQIEISNQYGGDCKNYNMRDMESFINSIQSNTIVDSILKTYSLISRETTVPDPIWENENYRNYNFDLNPKFIYAKSKSTKELTDSGSSNYIEFNSIKQIWFFYLDKFMNVPCSKSEIFISNDLELLEKQKLLNFIFAIMKIKNKEVDFNTTLDIQKDYDLDNNTLVEEIKSALNENANEFLSKKFSLKLKEMILIILGNISWNQGLSVSNTSNLTLNSLCDRIYKFLWSVQIFDNTPFLYPVYGSSEFSQAMCRLSAVYGSIFLVNERLKCKVYYNAEKLVNKEATKFVIDIIDEEQKCNFNVMTNDIIMNNIFIDDSVSRVQLHDNIKVEREGKTRLLKYTGIFVVKNINTLLNNNEGPLYYRIRKNDEKLGNKYGLNAVEYMKNSSCVPKNRNLVQVMIYSDEGEKDEEMFKGISQAIAKEFVSKRVESMEKEILENYNNKEKMKKINLGLIEIIEEMNQEEKNNDTVDKEAESNKEENKEIECKDQVNESEKEVIPEDKKEAVNAGEQGANKEQMKQNEEEENEKKETANSQDNQKKSDHLEQSDTWSKENEQQETTQNQKETEKQTAFYYIHKQSAPKEPIKERLSWKPEIILQYELWQHIEISKYAYINESDFNDDYHLIFTSNNFTEIDLDTYYDEFEEIIWKSKFAPSAQTEAMARKESEDFDNDHEEDKWINDLYNSIIPESSIAPTETTSSAWDSESK